MLEAEQPPQSSSLPIVSTEVKDRIIEDMGGANPNNLAPNLNTFSENVFADVLNSNRDFAQVINDVVTQKITHENPGTSAARQDALIEGMAIVLKAFDYTKQFDLLPRFARLEPDDLNLVKQTLEASIPSQEHTVTILQRLLNLPRIPEQQINLNECINTAGKSTSIFQQQVTTGATAMYKTLEVLWPILYPPQAPLPQQPTTP